MPVGKPHPQSRQRAAGEVGPALNERHGQAGQRAELRADHHGPDDQDRLVEQDPHRADLHGQHHERHEADRELGVLAGALLDLLPDDRIGRQAGGCLLSRDGDVG
jgi:hypothetical protein